MANDHNRGKSWTPEEVQELKKTRERKYSNAGDSLEVTANSVGNSNQGRQGKDFA